VDGRLTLAEELLLLAGSAADQPLPWRLHYGVTGALLADLDLAGRLGLAADGRVTVTDNGPAGDDELDAVLAEIASDKPQRVEYWIRELGSVSRTGRLANRLARRGDLRAEQTELRSRVSRVLRELTGNDDRAQALAVILGACGLAAKVFPNLDRRRIKQRVAELARGQRVAGAVREAMGDARLRSWLPDPIDFILP
jgi:hypothetical protein